MTTGGLPPEIPPVDPSLFEGGEAFSPPAGVVARLLLALDDRPLDLELLQSLVTPESLPEWGDFTDLAAHLHEFNWSLGSQGQEIDPDLVYIAIFEDNTGKSYYSLETVEVAARAIASVVFRPSLGGWRVHSLGQRPPDDAKFPRD